MYKNVTKLPKMFRELCLLPVFKIIYSLLANNSRLCELCSFKLTDLYPYAILRTAWGRKVQNCITSQVGIHVYFHHFSTFVCSNVQKFRNRSISGIWPWTVRKLNCPNLVHYCNHLIHLLAIQITIYIQNSFSMNPYIL